MEVNLEPVLDYIKAQNYKALEYEQNAKRDAAMNKWTVSPLSCCSSHTVCFVQMPSEAMNVGAALLHELSWSASRVGCT